MWRFCSLFIASLLVAGCSFDSGGLPMAGDGGGDDPDAPGAIDADPNAPDADPNAPDADPDPPDANPDPPDADVCVSECVTSDTYRDCDNGGSIVDCPLGCGGGTPHCFELDPSNGATADDLNNVTNGLEVATDEIATINSDTGQIDIDFVNQRIAGTGVNAGIGFYIIDADTSVVAVDFVDIETDGYLRIDGSRSLIILSRNDIDMAGLIDISGGCILTMGAECPGPGAGTGATGIVQTASGCGAGGNGDGGSGPEGGGGGGAMGQAGATGGRGNASNPGGSGGLTTNCPGATLEPLIGGSGGGIGGGGAGGSGGGGGGALQLSSYTAIHIVGTNLDAAAIWAAGAGGGGGFDTTGGGGGGAGGAILLEAPSITIDRAFVAANGGGGGGGVNGIEGETGGLTATRAAGGPGEGSSDGGLGGAADGNPTTGQENIDGAGGGGGGAGRIRFNVPNANLTITNTDISPNQTRGDPATL